MKKILILSTALSGVGFAAQADITMLSWGGAYGAAQNEAHVKPFTDDTGATLPNFTYDASFNDQALQGHLGAGVTARPASWPVALYAEGRMTRLIHNYSGGIVGNWNPTIVVGVRR